MQRFLTFSIFLLLIYSIVKSRIIDNDGIKNILNTFGLVTQLKTENTSDIPEEKTPELKGNFIEKTVSTIASNLLKTPQGKDFFNKLIQPRYDAQGGASIFLKSNSDDVVRSLFMVNDISIGQGPYACCGQKAKILYKIYGEKGDQSSWEKDIVIGNSDLSPNLDSIIVGMSKGGVRSAVLKNLRDLEKIENNKNMVPSVQCDISLLDLYPQNFEISKLRIFDDAFGYTIPILCGESIALKIKIIKLDNSEIYKSDKISFTLGQENDDWPEFFSYVLYNKMPVGSRFVITPTIYLERLAKKLSLNLDSDKYVIIEFYDIEILPAKQNIIK